MNTPRFKRKISEVTELKDYENDIIMTEWILFEMSFGQKYNVNTENGSR